MALYDLKLLDCTLRDGGYINNWKWGFDSARDIIRALVMARVDIVEVGFLRNVRGYELGVTVCNTVEELNQLLPRDSSSTMFSAMAMRSDYDVGKLSPYTGKGIEMIRITAHDYDIAEGMDFAREVKRRGYKLSVNPINIMGYSDERILWILEQVNSIQPYQFSIVDTFGSMKRRDLDRIVSLVDNNLDRNIRVAVHLHENMSLSCSLAQLFIDRHLNRPVAVDASLMGIGRTPGNLPVELIADYLNEYMDKAYDIDYMMDAIQDYIAPLSGERKWGYTPAYFLSARFNLHRNYAEHYLKKGDLTNKDINHILAGFDRAKCTAFDMNYADKIYKDYKKRKIDDSEDRARLKRELSGKKVLLIAPGASVAKRHDVISAFQRAQDVVSISLNFIAEEFHVDYAFFSNNKRFSVLSGESCKVIVTSNLDEAKADYCIDYDSLSGAFPQGLNSFVMALKLLKELGKEEVYVAGADGYSADGPNYYKETMRDIKQRDINFNVQVSEAIRCLKISIRFITPSAYDEQSGRD